MRVYKALAKHNIKFDIIAGTSIGAVNASIITSTQNNNNSAEIPESFWLTLAENILPPLLTPFFTDRIRSILSSIYGIMYGNSKAFIPKWFMLNAPDYLLPYSWTYLYDSTPLYKIKKEKR
jgi:NTE family protein